MTLYPDTHALLVGSGQYRGTDLSMSQLANQNQIFQSIKYNVGNYIFDKNSWVNVRLARQTS